MKFRIVSGVVLVFFLLITGLPFQATAGVKSQERVIVLAVFGTSVPGALPGVFSIRDAVASRFPATRVELAFTSGIIREIWHGRKGDTAFFAAHKGIPAGMTDIQGPLATIARLQDQGYDTILVQPGHISMGEEYLDLLAMIRGLNSIAAIKEKNSLFKALVAGRPALGTMGDKRPYSKDIQQVAHALKPDLTKAEAMGAALVYMGHGNDYFPSGGAYLQFAEVLSSMSAVTNVYIGTVEGFPDLDTVISDLQRDGVKKVLLKAFMTVAGDHAKNDMAGAEKNSWKNILTAAGFEVVVDMAGLGENDAFAAVFAEHLAETAADNGIVLE